MTEKEKELGVKWYTTKPIQKKAMKFTGDGDSIYSAEQWLGKAFMSAEEDPLTGLWFCIIGTLEGPHKCSPGDYIIQGLHGEFYPCKPKIFKKTYKEKELKC